MTSFVPKVISYFFCFFFNFTLYLIDNAVLVSGVWYTDPVICMLSCFSRVQLFATLWTVACQAPLSMGLSRQEYWSRFPCLPPGDLPNPRTEPMSLMSPTLVGGFFTFSATKEAHNTYACDCSHEIKRHQAFTSGRHPQNHRRRGPTNCERVGGQRQEREMKPASQ